MQVGLGRRRGSGRSVREQQHQDLKVSSIRHLSLTWLISLCQNGLGEIGGHTLAKALAENDTLEKLL